MVEAECCSACNTFVFCLFKQMFVYFLWILSCQCWWCQILPQLLYYFGVDNEVDSLDWASIVVYACEASCDASLPYKHEFAWVQIYVPSTAL